MIRHGQSIGNLTKTFLGHCDLDLSDLGYKQAECTANRLKNDKIDIIYSSDLSRAYNTALPNAKIRNIDVIPSKSFREVYVGEWENMKMDDIIAKWGREEYYINWVEGFSTFKFPSGESVFDAGRRFYNEVRCICDNNPGKTILISSHAAIIRSFWALISHEPFDVACKNITFPSNASFSICEYENGVFNQKEYSIDDHLNDIGITKVNLI